MNSFLFGSVKLTTNADPDKYKYSVYGIGFDSRSEFSFADGSMRTNVIFLELIWAYLGIMIIKIKLSSLLAKGQTQGLDGITLTAEAKYPINFTQQNKRFALSLHYNESKSF